MPHEVAMGIDVFRGGLPGQSPMTGFLGLLQSRHKVFVSYHHSNDQPYRDYFERLFTVAHNVMISMSVQIGGIDQNLSTETVRNKIRDEYLQNSSVTVVLVGSQTWQRKHVDWEISSSIRDTALNPRSGLIGILLPTYIMASETNYYNNTIPPRLYDNAVCGFATIHRWSNNPEEVSGWIHAAFERRTIVEPDNSYPHYINNKFGERWY